jgi:rhodanese-related sulfurtransferase
MSSIELTCDELKLRLEAGESVCLIDCREPWEHELVKIAESANIPMNDTPRRVEEYRAIEEPTVVYCHHGIRSMNVVGWLRSQGIENVQSLSGGIDAWTLTVDPSLPRY